MLAFIIRRNFLNIDFLIKSLLGNYHSLVLTARCNWLLISSFFQYDALKSLLILLHPLRIFSNPPKQRKG